MRCVSSWPREINRKWELARQVGQEGVATESAFSERRQPIPRSNWLLRLWQTHLSLPPSGCLPKVYVCMCVCVWGSRQTEASHRGSLQLQPNELAALALTHTPHTHTHSPQRRLSLQPWDTEEEGGEERRERQRVAERESEDEGVREERGRERQRETGGVWGRTPWLQIRGWLRCCYGLYHYRLWAPRELTATKVRVCACVCQLSGIDRVKQCIFSDSRD